MLVGATMEIRKATQKDASAVAELWTEAYVALGGGGAPEATLRQTSPIPPA
jgi:hypothetical protein